MREDFEKWMLKTNPRYHPSDDGISDRIRWEAWKAAIASLQSRPDTVMVEMQIGDAKFFAGKKEVTTKELCGLNLRVETACCKALEGLK